MGFLVICALLQLFFNKLYGWLLKGTIKSLKKTGKTGYSPVSELEFTDEEIIETTPNNKMEVKYSAVERVSIIENQVIYIHINNVMAYILPMVSFQSKEEYENFIGFLTEKGLIINKYEK